MPDIDLLVICLCAEWCGVCREYRARFDQVGAATSGARFVWLDIEDHADLVDPVEVDDFPTVLIAVGGQARFFGTVMPQPETLQRLIRAQQQAAAVALDDPVVMALLARLRSAQAL